MSKQLYITKIIEKKEKRNSFFNNKQKGNEK